jgi:hypothetical protein
MTTTSKICLRHRGTKELVCYAAESHIELCLGHESLPVWEVETVNKALIALAGGPSWSLGSYSRPAFSNGVKPENLEVVRREVIEEVYPVPTDRPLVLAQLFSCEKPTGVLRRYAGVDSLPEESTHLMLFELPDGKSVLEMKSLAGRIVRWQTGLEDAISTVHAVFAVPEDYEGDLSGKRGFAVAASGGLY